MSDISVIVDVSVRDGRKVVNLRPQPRPESGSQASVPNTWSIRFWIQPSIPLLIGFLTILAWINSDAGLNLTLLH